VAPHVRWIEEPAELEALAPEWDALAELDPTPFSLSAWYLAWWDGYGAGRRPRVCTVWDGPELVALLPLCEHGGRLEAMANEESAVVRPLARNAGALRLLADAAACQRYDLLEIRRLPEGDDGLDALAAAARSAGRLSIVEPDITSPIVDTTGTLEEYRSATRSKWHKNLRRLYRKLQRDHDGRLRLIEAPADLDSELAAGFEVESSGWKLEAGSAILSRPENEAYYRSLGRRFHDRGELRVSSISVDGRMIAWDLGILRRNRLYSPKSGYLEDFKQLGPGLILELAMIERCFELGIEAHELLGADDEYKLRFSTSERRHRYFRAYSRRPAQAVRYMWRRFVPRRMRVAHAQRLASAAPRPARSATGLVPRP
jgi:CelD/BcsL family acetyltransferase involved in cellulose biosynthesis